MSADATGALVVVLYICGSQGHLDRSWVLRSIGVWGGDGLWAKVTVVAHYLTFMLKYARRDNIGVPERESGS